MQGEYLASTRDDQLLWLAAAIRYVSMVARGTYVPDGDDLEDPKRMRKLNEIVHRISDHLLSRIDTGRSGIPDDIFFDYLSVATDAVNLRPSEFAKYCKIFGGRVANSLDAQDTPLHPRNPNYP